MAVTNLIMCFKILRGFTNIIPSEFFCVVVTQYQKSQYETALPVFQSNCSSIFFVRVVQLWNKLPEEVVSASGVSAFISRLNSMHVSF